MSLRVSAASEAISSLLLTDEIASSVEIVKSAISTSSQRQITYSQIAANVRWLKSIKCIHTCYSKFVDGKRLKLAILHVTEQQMIGWFLTNNA